MVPSLSSMQRTGRQTSEQGRTNSASQPGKPCDDEGWDGAARASDGRRGGQPVGFASRTGTARGNRRRSGRFGGTAGGAGRGGLAAGRAGGSGARGEGPDHGDAAPKGKREPLKARGKAGPSRGPGKNRPGRHRGEGRPPHSPGWRWWRWRVPSPHADTWHPSLLLVLSNRGVHEPAVRRLVNNPFSKKKKSVTSTMARDYAPSHCEAPLVMDTYLAL